MEDFGSTVFDSIVKQRTLRIYRKEQSIPNAYLFVENKPTFAVDVFGLQSWIGPGYGAFGPDGPGGSNSFGHCPCPPGKSWKSNWQAWGVYDSVFDCADKLWGATPPQNLPAPVQIGGGWIGLYPPIGAGLLGGMTVQYIEAFLYCDKASCQ